MSRQPTIVLLVLGVQHQKDQVETGQKSVGQIYIFDDIFLFVPLGVYGIGGWKMCKILKMQKIMKM